MRSNIAIIKAQNKIKAIKVAKTNILNILKNDLTTKPKAVRAVAKSLLLNSPYVINSINIEIGIKHLGLGVYEIYVILP